jgi:RNA methyltransferase, TrmH family
MIRAAEAAGAASIFVLNTECDPYDPATVRATMGSLFSQKVVRRLPREFTSWAKSNGVAIVASSPAGLMDYKALRYRFPAVLVIGSEKRGLSARPISWFASPCVEIATQSVAAGVLLFEMASQMP